MFLVAFVAIILISCGSSGELVDYPFDIEIIEVSGKSKQQLFDDVNKWAVQTFRKSDSVIEYKSVETGTISGKYVYDTHDSAVSWGFTQCRCLITVECKDGKVRITTQPIEVLYDYDGGRFVGRVKTWVPINEDAKEIVDDTYPNERQSTINSLKNYLNTAESDW